MGEITYKSAGVDVEAADRLVQRIARLAARTRRPEVIADVGGFGGLFALGDKWRDPVLVSGTDGVGTKLKIAFATRRHSTVGIDLVAMSVNDILTLGAEPLFFLDYFACGKLDTGVAEQVVSGVAQGCSEAGCALLGGETAEMPGFYPDGEYDLAGFAVGAVARCAVVDGKDVTPGDVVIGLASSGLHSNGYSLARKALLDDMGLALARPAPGLDRTLGEVLLEPTRIYVRPVLDLLRSVRVKAMAHITGEGIPGNLPRQFPQGCRAVISCSAWRPQPIFDLLRSAGVQEQEMWATFNMGLGYALVVARPDETAALSALRAAGEQPFVAGEIVAGETGVELVA